MSSANPSIQSLCLSLLVLVIGSSNSPVLHAQQNQRKQSSDGESETTDWKDLLTPSTIAIGCVQLDRIEVDSLAAWFMNLDVSRDPEVGMPLVTREYGNRLRLLKQLGASRLFITMTTRGWVNQTPLFACQTKSSDLAASVLNDFATYLVPNAPFETRKVRDWVLVGASQDLDGLDFQRETVPDHFRDVQLENAPQDGFEHHLVIAAPPMVREAAAALLPDRPLAGVPAMITIKTMALDLERIHFRWSLPPNPLFRVIIESETSTTIDQLSTIRSSPPGWPSLDQHDVSLSADERSLEFQIHSEPLEAVLKSWFSGPFADMRRHEAIRLPRKLGLAMHNYHSAFKQFPPVAVEGPDGQPTISWRLMLAPFLGGQRIWTAVDQAKPWNDPENIEAGKPMPDVFVTPDTPAGHTRYRMPVIAGSFWGSKEAKKEFRLIRDGTSHTVMLVMAPKDQSVPWLKPGMWELDEQNLKDSFFGRQKSTRVIMFDGATLLLHKEKVTEDELRAILTHAGGERVNIFR